MAHSLGNLKPKPAKPYDQVKTVSRPGPTTARPNKVGTDPKRFGPQRRSK